jgi:hypothetical protein
MASTASETSAARKSRGSDETRAADREDASGHCGYSETKVGDGEQQGQQRGALIRGRPGT